MNLVISQEIVQLYEIQAHVLSVMVGVTHSHGSLSLVLLIKQLHELLILPTQHI